MLLCLVKGFPGFDLDTGRLALMFAFLRFGMVFRAWLLGCGQDRDGQLRMERKLL